MSSEDIVQIFTDGSVRPIYSNRAGIGVVIIDRTNLFALGKNLGYHLEINVTEMIAIEYGLLEAIQLGFQERKVVLHSDSRYCVDILNLNSRMIEKLKEKRKGLRSILERIQDLRDQMSDLTLQWIPRRSHQYHRTADQLAGQASRGDFSIRKFSDLVGYDMMKSYHSRFDLMEVA